MTAYSDYPFPDHFPNYLHNSRIMEYLRMYVQHFHLLKHIQFLVSGAGSTQLVQNLLGRVKSQARVKGSNAHLFSLGGYSTGISSEVSRISLLISFRKK